MNIYLHYHLCEDMKTVTGLICLKSSNIHILYMLYIFKAFYLSLFKNFGKFE